MKLYKSLIILAISLFLLLAGIVTVTVIILMTGSKQATEQNFNTILTSLDRDIAAGYFMTAAENFKTAAGFCTTAKEYLRLLKRVFLVDKARKEEGFLKKYSLAAWKKFPTDEKITFLACFSAIRNNNLVTAGDLLKKAGKSEILNRLRLQIGLLKGKPEDAQVLKLGESISEVLRLLPSEDPVMFEQIGTEMANKQLLSDAAVLFMQNGNLKEAYTLTQHELFADEYDAPAAFIAYDNGELDTALFRMNRLVNRFPENAEYRVLAGDFYFQNSEYPEAKFSYLKARNYDNKDSPTLYLNLNWIYQNETNYRAAEVALEDGLDAFPGNPDLLFEKGKLLRKQGRYLEAGNLITAFPGNLNANLKLLLLSLNQKTMPPEQFSIKLWEIYNENADDENICRTLVSQLLKLDNIKDAETAMNIYTAASGIKVNSWLLHYRGLIAGINKDWNSAEQWLTESLNLKEDQLVRYNLGVIQLKAGQYRKAQMNFEIVLKQDQAAINRARPFYSRVAARIGETMAVMGDKTGALKQYDYALELFPQNYHTILLRRKLETINE